MGLFSLAYAFNYGEGVPEDLAKAAELFQKACDGGLAEACE